ncbi:hypothetical protein PB1_00395 [Bacillus methanolicus PB1]|uniref:Uncharacterized protein n=1 Tax=Bacillus methanolicus PB1 TaxID=997296 RepID=I3E4D7_BACMT|nr:hypothetical protein PB1_00395 [Bacillus methanolicus PB1]
MLAHVLVLGTLVLDGSSVEEQGFSKYLVDETNIKKEGKRSECRMLEAAETAPYPKHIPSRPIEDWASFAD